MSRLRRVSDSLRRIAFPLIFSHVYAKLQHHFPMLSSCETTLIVGELEDWVDAHDTVSLYSFKMENDEDKWRLDFIRWDSDRRGFRVVIQAVVRSANEEDESEDESSEV